jgi:hypothetical protein
MAVMTRSAFALLAVLGLSAVPASAQTPAPADSVPRAMLDRAASSNWYLRAITFDAPHDTIVGRIRMTNGRYRIGDEWVERSTIQSLDRRVDRGSGALLGALVGAIVVGALAEGLADWNDPDNDSPNYFAFGMGAGAGAMFGMFTGHAIHPGRTTWTTIWPAP